MLAGAGISCGATRVPAKIRGVDCEHFLIAVAMKYGDTPPSHDIREKPQMRTYSVAT